MPINSVNSTQSAAAHANSAVQNAARKPSKPFPSMAELMVAGQNNQQSTEPTSSVNTTDVASQIRRA